MASSANDHRIDNIEFAVVEIARSRAFYGKAFGWNFKDYGLIIASSAMVG